MYTMYTFSIHCVYIYMYIIVYTLSHTYTTNIQMPLQSWWPSLDCQDHLATMHATQFPILFLPWGNHFPAVAEYILWWSWHSLGVRGSNSSWLRTPRLRPIYVMRKNMKWKNRTYVKRMRRYPTCRRSLPTRPDQKVPESVTFWMFWIGPIPKNMPLQNHCRKGAHFRPRSKRLRKELFGTLEDWGLELQMRFGPGSWQVKDDMVRMVEFLDFSKQSWQHHGL